jgi:O-glycosyl hydrolase
VRSLHRYLVLAFLCAAPLAAAIHHDVVHIDVRYQVLDNFGASDAWSMQKIGAWPEEVKESVAQLLFSPVAGIGLSCWRFNLGAGPDKTITNPWRTAETFEVSEGKYDWSRQANERWFLRAAKRYGVPYFLAFANSPPARMTQNGLTHTTKGMGTTNLKPGYEAQYARYLADILQHFHQNKDTRERIDFQYVSPVNEPMWEWDGVTQEGNRYSNADIKTVLTSLDQELHHDHLDTEIIAPESGSLQALYEPVAKMTNEYKTTYGDYIDALLGDDHIRKILNDRIAYHAYGSDRLDTELVQRREAVRAKLARYKKAQLWETEYCILEGPEGKGGHGRDLTMNTALDVARVMHYDLTIANASAWQWWLAMSNSDFKDGLLYTDYQKSGDAPSIITSKLLWTFGNFSKFIRPGMQRVELQGEGHDMRGLLGSAWLDEDRSRLVVVYLNEGTTDETILLSTELKKQHVYAPDVYPFITSDKPEDDLKQYPTVQPDSHGVLTYTIPARSAVTLVGTLMAESQ